MSRYHSYLRSAVDLLSSYDGTTPFAPVLKRYFSEHKKMGSTDRKQVAQLCYSFFRLGQAKRDLPLEERLLMAHFLCATAPGPLLAQLQPQWNEVAHLSISEKCALPEITLHPSDIFPWQAALSEQLDINSFALSHLQQPALFLRLRPGKEKKVTGQLTAAGIPYQQIATATLALPNAARLDGIITPDQDAVIQDYSSQRVGELLQAIPVASKPLKVWDCCAASGGKSILAVDTFETIALTVTDIRESIIHNLKGRFARAGISSYRSFVTDLSTGTGPVPTGSVDLLIADLPCTGSGTWGRTPEQLYFFQPEKINHYASLQRKILDNVLPTVAPGGYLLYCTCSVFREENEEAVNYIEKKGNWKCLRSQLITGYTAHADTMFAALFQRSL